MPEFGLAARAGLHTGDLERVDIDDIAGLTPVIASRISDAAGSGELLASRLTSDLLVGSEHAINSLGLHNLKAFPIPSRSSVSTTPLRSPSRWTSQRSPTERIG